MKDKLIGLLDNMDRNCYVKQDTIFRHWLWYDKCWILGEKWTKCFGCIVSGEILTDFTLAKIKVTLPPNEKQYWFTSNNVCGLSLADNVTSAQIQIRQRNLIMTVLEEHQMAVPDSHVTVPSLISSVMIFTTETTISWQYMYVWGDIWWVWVFIKMGLVLNDYLWGWRVQ